jgi:hypothetical protein
MNIRRVTAALGLPVLLLGLVTTSAAAAGPAPAPAPSIVKHSVNDGQCDHIRFQTDSSVRG